MDTVWATLMIWSKVCSMAGCTTRPWSPVCLLPDRAARTVS
jgi:hypothetical protein